MKTWHFEQAVVATVLVAVAVASGGGALELLGAGAVLLSFGHASVADRLAEAERERRAFSFGGDTDKHAVACHRWATRYLVGKEALWLAYFVLHHSWSALAGRPVPGLPGVASLVSAPAAAGACGMTRAYTTYPTQDEAIAAAIRESAPGETVEVHTAECKIVEDPETGEVLKPCTCESIVLTVGAVA
jgi:hypothetical protein